ncbi:MAG: MoaD/ThiS family protein [Planctomycetia bacterium]|nr:MoaD/ThiS family protein [Planctomycetia bacterium]
MTIRVRLFAVAREAAGADFIDLDLREGASVGELRQAFLTRLPSLGYATKQLLFAVGGEYATDATIVAAGSEVACIPPVSGG